MRPLHKRPSFTLSPEERQLQLAELCQQLRELPEIASKSAIRHAAALSAQSSAESLSLQQRYAAPGDDCAAFACTDGYQLLAMEGMLPDFVAKDPKAAGWSSVMANVSDIAAMGGRPTAIANAFWHHDDEASKELLFHIKRACDVFGLQFAGGHSSIRSDYRANLAVAIIGHAHKLLSCHHLRPGQRLFILSDFTGSWHGKQPYWGCVGGKSPKQIRQQWQCPAELAERDLAVAAKDISGGGVLGTLLMMLELTGCGATLDISAIPRPPGDLLRWLRAFQAFGFLLAVEPDQVQGLIGYFQHSHLSCIPVGTITGSGCIELDYYGSRETFWDLKQNTLTAMGGSTCPQ
ncbi:AIR synthase-related protein, sll0787 family [Spongiibacter sp. IMCC21906]|uniref:sll0787 family AIR synthase-like protein n=1 Tax=Spongiibacter sp. IMCC21906 TaxID=1620392 RepID=UPI00062E0AB3|nr:sll0787 family AIR synthase-like protein [Spongiibacter sp. IMCC21906]AKH68937.1 AIR synthase-related protein, sll0787 family [Spongiibacter sp. IMCC21906]